MFVSSKHCSLFCIDYSIFFRQPESTSHAGGLLLQNAVGWVFNPPPTPQVSL
ncbi:MAG: hypothetical protein IKX14_00900 [Neisseriaceae bacterium]|nr:hypothetical protein [Neisseriaceae bacterium]